jgi:hypothetical protein
LFEKKSNPRYTDFMNSDLRNWFLREYGAWSVLIISALAGLGVSKEFSWKAVLILIALSLLVNSKQAYTTWAYQAANKRLFFGFLLQVLVAGGVFVAVFGDDIFTLVPLLFFPVAYLLLCRLAGEHALSTELLGFLVLSLAAIIMKFLMFRGLDVRLFVAVACYFMAGVFKVKALPAHKTKDRIASLLYIMAAAFAYRGMHIPLIILLPLLDNLVAAVAPYRVKLETTGWIEVGKGVVFLGLLTAFY